MNQETKTNKTGFTTKSITMMALFAAILCISAYISIPLPIPGRPHMVKLCYYRHRIAFPTQSIFHHDISVDGSWRYRPSGIYWRWFRHWIFDKYFRWIHILFLSDRHCTSTDPRQKIQSNPIHNCCYCRRCIDRYHRNALLEG